MLWLPFILLLTLIFTLRPVVSSGWLLCLVLGLMIPQFSEIQSHWLRYTSHRIATYSYGIYLSHQFCIWLALGVLASHSLVLKITVLVVMLVTAPVILYHLIEAPMKLGSRWANAIL
jgi:peptidoglycan/LPS O-acetylase OafA/YrhL